MPRHKSKPEPHSTPSPGWLPDEANPATHHRLEGLEPDNLLAFLALLGLLRALETARPEWRPRAYWDEDSPWRPVLVLSVQCTQKGVAQAAKEGLGEYSFIFCAIGGANRKERRQRLKRELKAKASELRLYEDSSSAQKEKGREKNIEKIKKEIEKIRKQIKRESKDLKTENFGDREIDIEIPLQNVAYMQSFVPEVRRVLSSLCVKLSSDREKGVIKPTPLKFVSGQQAFLGTAIKLLREVDIDEIAESLWRPWRYRHRGDTFRFDRAEYRAYAYLAFDPTQKPKKKAGQEQNDAEDNTGQGLAPSERGANALAVLGLLSFPVFYGVDDVATFAYSSGRLSERRISLPIWHSATKEGTSLAAIETLLRLDPEPSAFTPQEVRCWSIFRIVPSGRNNEYKCSVWEKFFSAPLRRFDRPEA